MVFKTGSTLAGAALFAAAIVAPQVALAGGDLKSFTDELEGVEKLDRSTLEDTRGQVSVSLDLSDFSISDGSDFAVSEISGTVKCTNSGCTSSF